MPIEKQKFKPKKLKVLTIVDGEIQEVELELTTKAQKELEDLRKKINPEGCLKDVIL